MHNKLIISQQNFLFKFYFLHKIPSNIDKFVKLHQCLKDCWMIGYWSNISHIPIYVVTLLYEIKFRKKERKIALIARERENKCDHLCHLKFSRMLTTHDFCLSLICYLMAYIRNLFMKRRNLLNHVFLIGQLVEHLKIL